MIIVPFKINEDNLVGKIPESWDDLTFGMLLKLSKCKTNAEKIGAMLGITAEQAAKAKIKSKDTKINIDAILQIIKFLDEPPPPFLPKTVLGYKIPEDLAFECIAQFEDVTADIKLHEKDDSKLMDRYPLYVASYACEQKHGEYDWQKAEAMAHEFLKAPASEVLAVGNFMLTRLIGLASGTDPGYLIKALQMTRRPQGLRDWLNLLGFMVRSYTWKIIRRIKGTSF